MAGEIGPEYRQVMGQIRSWISSGEYPVGSQIPSTAELRHRTGLSLTVVRRAVQQLQADGILEGHPGKGVFVRALPESADAERMDLKALSDQVAQLRELAERDGLDEIRARIGQLETALMDLYAKLAYDYPGGGTSDTPRAAAGRGRGR